MNAIYNLLDTRAEYRAKMLHPLPRADSISRERYLLQAAKGRVVVDIGASGPMSEAIQQAAGEYHSINRDKAEFCVDLDNTKIDFVGDTEDLPPIKPDVVIAGEVIEHLSNPGHFLDILHYWYSDCPVILTTPNAMASSGYESIRRGSEMVNPEHVAYYSYWTLKTLVERHAWRVVEWYWYNGDPGTAEGLIFVLGGDNA